MHNFKTNKGKFVYTYMVRPNGIVQKTDLNHLLLNRKTEEYEVLKAEIKLLRQ